MSENLYGELYDLLYNLLEDEDISIKEMTDAIYSEIVLPLKWEKEQIEYNYERLANAIAGRDQK